MRLRGCYLHSPVASCVWVGSANDGQNRNKSDEEKQLVKIK